MEPSMRVRNVWVEQVDQDYFTISADTKKKLEKKLNKHGVLEIHVKS